MVLNFISSLHLVVLARLLLTIKKMPVICYMFQYFKIFLLSVFLISAFLGVANWGVCSSTLWYPECLIDCISIVLASTASNLSVSFLCHSLQWNLKSGLYRESERERESFLIFQTYSKFIANHLVNYGYIVGPILRPFIFFELLVMFHRQRFFTLHSFIIWYARFVLLHHWCFYQALQLGNMIYLPCNQANHSHKSRLRPIGNHKINTFCN